ncbi:MAG: type II toxin-antitoxin system VapC family toxin [Planctomycetes bacterium]|nr:type II toxin-antitoxin system VapC family toxin [Planctomycetota bacterium]
MSAYFDTSALAKKYVRESGSDRVLRLLRAPEIAATSTLAYAEIYAAFARRLREGSITRRQHEAAARAFERDWKALVIVDLSDEVLSAIPGLLSRGPLRSADAIHLASAIWLRARLRRFGEFVSADGALLEAARRSGFVAIDPARP